MDKPRYKTVTMVLFTLWTAFILCASLAPDTGLPSEAWWHRIPYYDKIAHFGLYFTEIILVTLLFRLKTRGRMTALVCITVLSGVIEILQEKYFGRSGSVYDLSANILGAVCGLAALWFFERSAYKKS